VKRVTDIMAEISAASDEQSAGIEEVNQAIVQMDDMTQQNAALVEEAAAAAEAMQGQAEVLAQAVSTFKLEAGKLETITNQPVIQKDAGISNPAVPAIQLPAIQLPANRVSAIQQHALAASAKLAALASKDQLRPAAARRVVVPLPGRTRKAATTAAVSHFGQAIVVQKLA
jgi:methyl-accepting chemotaxis protein-1 (serine sensor receptor)